VKKERSEGKKERSEGKKNKRGKIRKK